MIRYVFTVISKAQPVPIENPLEQRVWIDKMVKIIKEQTDAEHVGVMAVVESPKSVVG